MLTDIGSVTAVAEEHACAHDDADGAWHDSYRPAHLTADSSIHVSSATPALPRLLCAGGGLQVDARCSWLRIGDLDAEGVGPGASFVWVSRVGWRRYVTRRSVRRCHNLYGGSHNSTSPACSSASRYSRVLTYTVFAGPPAILLEERH